MCGVSQVGDSANPKRIDMHADPDTDDSPGFTC